VLIRSVRSPHKLHVLFLEAGSGRGGSTTSLIYTLRYLNRELFDPVVAFYFRNYGPDTDSIRALGIPVRFASNRLEPSQFVPFRFLLGRTRRRWLRIPKILARLAVRWPLIELPQLVGLLRIIRRYRINLVFLNNDVHYHVVGMLAARIMRAPIVCHKAGGVGEGRRIKRFITPWVNVFMAPSHPMEADQRSQNPGTRRLVTIPGGVDLDAFTPRTQESTARAELGIAPGQKVIGSVSRFHRGKGQRELIEATALIVREYPQTVCLLVGDDASPGAPLDHELRARVAELGLEDNVRFAGWRSDVRDLLAIMDVFVHCPTSWIEALSVSLLEAMAMAKPSVVSINGGMTDAIIDGVTGFLVTPGDIGSMASKTLYLLRNPAVAEAFGRSARELVERDFSSRATTRRIEGLLYEVATGGRAQLQNALTRA